MSNRAVVDGGVAAPDRPSTALPKAEEVEGRLGTVSGMRARAHVATERRSTPGSQGRSCLSTLRSEAPLVLRIARAKSPEPWVAPAADVVRVCLAAGAAGPVGGDQLTLDIEVGAGSSLVLSEVSPTLLLPGPHGQRSCTVARITVGDGGTLIWLPEPMIAARGCDHLNVVSVCLDDGARFFLREEILLGRHGETSGHLGQRVSVRLAGRPLYRQDLSIGTPGADSPAVMGGHRALGSTLVVEPAWVDRPRKVRRLGGDAAVLPLDGPAAVVTALGSDNLQLRAHLEAGLEALGAPWDRARQHDEDDHVDAVNTRRKP